MLNEPDSIFTAALFQAFSPVANNVLRAGLMFASSANYAHGKSKKKILSATLLDQHTFGTTDLHAGVKLIREYYDYYVPGQGFGNEAQAIANQWQSPLFNLSAGVSKLNRKGDIFNFVINSGILPTDKTALQQITGDDGNPILDAATGNQITGGLKREARTGAEFGWKQHAKAGNIIWTLFFMNQKNTSEFTGTPYYDDRNVLRYYMKNIDLTTLGLEMVFRSVEWFNCLSLSANASFKYVGSKETSSRKRYTRQPPFIANVIASYSRKAWEANIAARYVSAYNTDRFLKQETSIGNYCNTDIFVAYSIPRLRLQLFGSATNVFDIRYATVSPIYPDFGRQFKTGIRFVVE
jgi:iron complex outermembrane receptor protein